MYCVQGFAGYPPTAICLQVEGRRLLKDFGPGKVVLTEQDRKEMANVGMTAVADDSDRKTIIPKIPDKWNSPILMLGKLGIIAYLAIKLGEWTGSTGQYGLFSWVFCSQLWDSWRPICSTEPTPIRSSCSP